MTTDLEKQFYTTFGIEPFIYCSKPRLDCDARSKGTCRKDCEYYSGVLYPQITDSILLELICVVLNTFQTFEVYRIMDINSLKEKILKLLILAQDDVYSQVRTLFKEEK